MRRVAVVGSGIAGLATAWHLSDPARAPRTGVTLFEAGDYFGGHTHTVDVTLEGVTHGVDTGFLVFNERTYPRLIRLFEQLQVRTAPSDMSFSVQVPQGSPGRTLEWSGSSLATVFSQKRNLLSPAFMGMLADLLRFNRLTTALAHDGRAEALDTPLEDFLDQHGFGRAFREWYLLPMLGCIWSCPTDQMLRFPTATMIRFCHNHGLLQVANRPQWYTVHGGARQYVRRMLERIADARLHTPVNAVRRDAHGVHVHSKGQWETFDELVLACHSDQALELLGPQASALEREILGAIRYQPNTAVLHTDTGVMPRRRPAWAAWNFESGADAGSPRHRVCLHYWINRLQPLPFEQPVIVSLNPVRAPREDKVLQSFEYAHPVFDRAAIRAQQRLPLIQGQRNTWFAGAWTGYGFHEDGLKSALAVVDALQADAATAPEARSLRQVA
jgi:predicted NAD/FAD-binding protein